MSWLCVAPIVEGDGEIAAVPVLLRDNLLPALGIHYRVRILSPIKVPRAFPGLTVRNLCLGRNLFDSEGLVSEPIGDASKSAFLKNFCV